jgi:uncharacterized membrane protein YraQ (UPF0718 family)
MGFIFRKEEQQKAKQQMLMPEPEVERPFWQNLIFFAVLVFILIFANWAKPDGKDSIWILIFNNKWMIVSILGLFLGVILIKIFQVKAWKIGLVTVLVIIAAILSKGHTMIPFIVGIVGISWITSRSKGEMGEWFSSTWEFARQILPLLLFGVIIAGLLLARPGQEGLIPSAWVARLVGGNSLWANLFASVVGAFMYFATLTEVPILQGLIGNGMGKGPALALLLAGPALSLPNMLVIRSVIGTRKTLFFVTLVIIMATVSGIIFGLIT